MNLKNLLNEYIGFNVYSFKKNNLRVCKKNKSMRNDEENCEIRSAIAAPIVP